MHKEQHNFALVCARGLGDALISMVLAHNLALSKKQVVIFSSVLCGLRDWFPTFQIQPYPIPENLHSTFASFEAVIAADHSLVKETHHFGNSLLVLKENAFNKKNTMVENLQKVCSANLFLPFAKAGNGIAPPQGLKWKKYPKRVLLHPTSSDEKKNWPAKKFIALAESLEKEGYSPYFCVDSQERKLWQDYVDESMLPLFPSLSHLASFVYESGFLIGNDSGVGHLASALNIPTLSLFARKSYSHLWRPGWGIGHVIAPPDLVPGSRIKQKFWKDLLSVRRVKNAFQKLREETLAHPSLDLKSG